MTKEKVYVAIVKQHGQSYEYWGDTYDQALMRAQASTSSPLWPTIYVFNVYPPQCKVGD